jgi:GxxExxY protein
MLLFIELFHLYLQKLTKNIFMQQLSQTYINHLTFEINGVLIEVHKHLGPGLLEKIYHRCLLHELTLREIPFESEANLPFSYKDLDLSSDLRCDIIVDNCVMIEIKAVQEIIPYFKAKLISHMKLAKVPRGILVNFNVSNIMSEGYFPLKNDYYDALPI